MTQDTVLSPTDVRNKNKFWAQKSRLHILDVLQKLTPYTEKYSCSLSNLIIYLTAASLPDLHVLCGARKPEQIIDNVKTLSLNLEEADLSEMSQLFEQLRKLYQINFNVIRWKETSQISLHKMYRCLSIPMIYKESKSADSFCNRFFILLISMHFLPEKSQQLYKINQIFILVPLQFFSENSSFPQLLYKTIVYRHDLLRPFSAHFLKYGYCF